jgi:predicted nicotinamide N-methyase
VTPAPDGSSAPRTLDTPTGPVPLHEFHLRLAGREWTVLHTGLLLTFEEEQAFLKHQREKLPYGVALWPSAIALAYDLADRGEALKGASVLELGAGTGLPGIVAASLGARVVQTDRHEMAMAVCARNGAANGVTGVERRMADWTAWDIAEQFDFILGSDILYTEALHPHLAAILNGSLAPGGRALLSDPFRAPSLRLLESLEAEGWSISLATWNLGGEEDPRVVGVYELGKDGDARK